MRLLIVEDDEILRNGLSVGLSLQGFSPDAVGSLVDARHALQAGGFDALVLDRMLPDGDGLTLLSELRAAALPLPVLLLTARDAPDERVAGLDGGADDYLGKPFELSELAARLRAILRRAEGRAAGELRWNGLRLDPARMLGWKDGVEIAFSRREFALLHALMTRPGAVLGKLALEERLYGWQEDIESNTIEVHVHKLRQKLGAGYIETLRGMGYRLAAEEEEGR